MNKIIKYFKPFLFQLFLIVVLLISQAALDLSLPDYMGRMVSIGIAGSGIQEEIPNEITDKSYQNMDWMSKALYEKGADTFFISESESYILQEELSPLEEQQAKDLTILLAMLYNPSVGEESIGSAVPSIEVLKEQNIPEQKNQLETLLTLVTNMQENTTQTLRIGLIRQEYEALGVDLEAKQMNYIYQNGGIMVVLALLSAICIILVVFLSSKLASKLGNNLREAVFTHVLRFGSQEHGKFSVSTLITRSTNDITQIQTLLVILLRIIFYAPALGIGAIYKISEMKSSMSWIIVIAIGMIGSLLVVILGMAIPRFKKIQTFTDEITRVARESLTGILTVRAFSNENLEVEKFEKANENLTQTTLFVSRIMIFLFPMMTLVMNLVTLLILWFGAKEVEASTLQVGEMMSFIQYATQIIMAFLMFSMLTFMYPRAAVSAERIAEVLEMPIEIASGKVHGKPSGTGAEIKFDNVTFQYNGSEKPVLQNINLKINPGEMIGIIGGTGSGKTTLLELMMRFLDTTQGQILLDGQPIKELELDSLRSKIAYVPQKANLFSGTLESNLTFGREEFNQEELDRVVDIAQIKEFMDPDLGYEMKVSQGGSNFSGGQRQRISIGRALMKNSPVVMFDDSFSALDAMTESAIKQRLQEEDQGKTLIIVSQKISSIAKADAIIVVHQREIAGIGTHEELMKECKVYQEIAESQGIEV